MTDLHDLTIAAITDGLERGDFSSEEITRHCLDRIEHLDRRFNSFVTVTRDRALAQARTADRTRAGGRAGRLTGVPIAHKDIFCTTGVRSSCASRMLDNFISPYDATVVARMREAGIVMLGKTNMDEFAMGSSNETSYYGPVHNPWDTGRVPGGSSGGSAAAVAARLAPAATGTDTGGSIRQPAALCGITGLKPTYGRVSRYGIIAFASSLDQAGPMTRTAEDAALLLGAMAGYDPLDSTSSDREIPDFTADLDRPLQGLRIGVPAEYFGTGLDTGTAEVVNKAIATLEELGATAVEVTLPHTNLAVPAYYVIAPAEASTNLARYDGVRYGYRCENPADLLDLYTRTRAEGFGNEVKRRILIGTYVLSAGYADAYYRKARRIRRLIKNDFVAAFGEVDVIIGPTSPSPAFALGAKTADPVQMYLEDTYTIPTSLAGLPAISVPAGFVNGLPVGMQIIGQAFEEAKLLRFAHQFQQVTNFHQHPPTAAEEHT